MNTDRLVESYLKALEVELKGLPGNRRLEILEEVREHIAEARAGLNSETEIRTMLERLGSPEEIASEAKQRFGVIEKAGTPILEILTFVLLLIPIAGWVTSAVLVWLSSRWTGSEKTIGTIGALAFIPIGMISFLIPSGNDQSPVGVPVTDAPVFGDLELVVLLTVALALALPLATAIFLAVRLRSHRQAATV
ncbi:MAG: DUF1700 domain-containing protein [Acidimicrobiia bacterium]